MKHFAACGQHFIFFSQKAKYNFDQSGATECVCVRNKRTAIEKVHLEKIRTKPSEYLLTAPHKIKRNGFLTDTNHAAVHRSP